MANALHHIRGEWISDGNGTLNQQYSSLKASSECQGTPFNIMFQADAPPRGSMYYQVEIQNLTGSISVGVVKTNDFLPGWKTVGMFYNGNVTNGSSALIVDFGENPATGGTVGVYICRNAVELRILFYCNSRCLGTAFQLSEEECDNIFVPCIQVSGEVELVYSAPDQLPTSTEREHPKFSDSYLGKWKLYEAYSGSDQIPVNIPTDVDTIFNMLPGKFRNTYALGVKVANQIHATIEKVAVADEYDQIKIGPVMSTRMMPPTHLLELERYLAESLPKLHKMRVSNETLILVGTTVQMKCTAFYETFLPSRHYR